MACGIRPSPPRLDAAQSYVAHKLRGYLTWTGYQCRVFNVGKHRRERPEPDEHSGDGVGSRADASFFSSDNSEAKQYREQLAMEVLDEAISWLCEEGGAVALFDATNTTRARRQRILSRVEPVGSHVGVIFVECICNQPGVLASNMLQKVCGSPDFARMPLQQALEDLSARIENYKAVYEPLEDAEGGEVAYIKLIDLQSKVVARNIFGSLAHSILAFLMSIHIHPRPVFLLRSGQCGDRQAVQDAVLQRASVSAQGVAPDVAAKAAEAGATADLSTLLSLDQQGLAWSKAVGVYAAETAGVVQSSSRKATPELAHDLAAGQCSAGGTASMAAAPAPAPRFATFTSTLQRCIQTAEAMDLGAATPLSALLPMDTGVYAGLPLRSLAELDPAAFKAWQHSESPDLFRIAGGESLRDVATRLTSLVVDIERCRCPVVVVGHLSSLQVLMAYFRGIPLDAAVQMPIPSGTVIELVPSQYGWIESAVTVSGGDSAPPSACEAQTTTAPKASEGLSDPVDELLAALDDECPRIEARLSTAGSRFRVQRECVARPKRHYEPTGRDGAGTAKSS